MPNRIGRRVIAAALVRYLKKESVAMKRLSVERSANCTAPIVNSAIGIPNPTAPSKNPTLHAERSPPAHPASHPTPTLHSANATDGSHALHRTLIHRLPRD